VGRGVYRGTDAAYVFESQLGDIGDEEAFGVAADAAGNVYMTGSNTGPTNINFQGGYDMFVAKFNAGGTRQSIKNLGSTGNEVARAVPVAGSNVYVVGGTTISLGGEFAGGGFDLVVATFAP
jgi:hypothetical protein